MTRTTITRNIAAPVELVFRTIADISNYSEVIPQIVGFEMVSGDKPAVGTRFRETRLMKGKEMTTELEITEYLENDRIRMVADSHGTVWDTLFTVKQGQGQTELNITMEARAHKLLPKLINPFIKGMIRNLIAKDMDAVKAHCER